MISKECAILFVQEWIQLSYLIRNEFNESNSYWIWNCSNLRSLVSWISKNSAFVAARTYNFMLTLPFPNRTIAVDPNWFQLVRHFYFSNTRCHSSLFTFFILWFVLSHWLSCTFSLFPFSSAPNNPLHFSRTHCLRYTSVCCFFPYPLSLFFFFFLQHKITW